MVLTAIINVGLQLSANPDHLDCSCTTGFNGSVFGDCEFGSAVCAYIAPSADPDGVLPAIVPSVRARFWRWGQQQQQHVGASRGWQAPFSGYPASSDGIEEAFEDALADLKAKYPSTVCTAKVPPMVVVPGLTSSNLEYRLTKSAPPAWAFWCEHNTDGWEPLWPYSNDILASPTKFLCKDLYALPGRSKPNPVFFLFFFPSFFFLNVCRPP